MATLSKQQFSEYIRGFDFHGLLNHMGWDNDATRAQSVKIGDAAYALAPIVQKNGFRVLQCPVVPDYATRRKIEAAVEKLFHEHLIIYTDNATEQIWQLVVREAGKPARVSETRWHKSQDPELLYQRASGMVFALAEEDTITIVDVRERVLANLQQNTERITKRFYDFFKKEHDSFARFITGIEGGNDRAWYASLMLNRLMFCYFIQKRGFLNDDKDYLKNKLAESREKHGADKFYSFYRNFLLVLFHAGLGSPHENDKKLCAALGNIPYLNGGLFDIHELEKNNAAITIPDDAFEKLFDFFDQWEWHLDTRPDASGREINPDVLGYIFEKYINDRAEMGAYYTKEDITDYIGKNCIIPFLFGGADFTKARSALECGAPAPLSITADKMGNAVSPVAPESGRGLPHSRAGSPHADDMAGTAMLRANPDRYIYPAMLHGADKPLPSEIAAGIADVSKRTHWNRPAPPEYALPTEIWREVVDRRHRLDAVRAKIAGGEINSINDFITHNLDIRQFAQDAVENTDDPAFLRTFWKKLSTVTVLDPTCGSGAFLFAALNILKPLYEAALLRMENFIADEMRAGGTPALECGTPVPLSATPGIQSGRGLPHSKADCVGRKFPDFQKILNTVRSPAHPNRDYFIYKSIILNNLHGVDIMREAVEIAKLRLFLKLVSAVDPDRSKSNYGLEPLPDMDFNILAGNTLVGFATKKELDDAFIAELDLSNQRAAIEEKCEIVARAFTRYKEIQLAGGNDEGHTSFKTAKDDLNARLRTLNDELNKLLYKENRLPFSKWLETHRPFHWFAEFYEILQNRSGFDVIIGNPPYVEMRKINYALNNYKTEECGNLYAPIVERSSALTKMPSHLGMIVPVSIVSIDGFEPLRKTLLNQNAIAHFLNFGVFPSKLFEGVAQRLTILLLSPSNGENKIYTSPYRRWLEAERSTLFETSDYAEISNIPIGKIIPKTGKIGVDIRSNVNTISACVSQVITTLSVHMLYYHRSPNNFIRSHCALPFYRGAGGENISKDHMRILTIDNQKNRNVIVGLLMSSLFFWHWEAHGNCRNVTDDDIRKFPLNISHKLQTSLCSMVTSLMDDMGRHAKRKVRHQKKTGDVLYDEYYVKESKPILDAIDRVLAEHYGFTEEELDFIINYDIKYRMGAALNEEE